MNQVTVRKSRRGIALHDSNPFMDALVEQQAKQATHTQFVKLYTLGAKVLRSLTTAGTKVFAVLYLEVRKHMGEDLVYLNFGLVDQATNPMSKATFMRGMSELLNKGFIAESALPSKYFLNPHYIWNGNRTAFLKANGIAASSPTTEDTE
jgi:hypothetical protein